MRYCRQRHRKLNPSSVHPEHGESGVPGSVTTSEPGSGQAIGTNKPAPPPKTPSRRLSVSSWRIRRNRPAPIASRMQNSCVRADALASIRCAMFTRQQRTARPSVPEPLSPSLRMCAAHPFPEPPPSRAMRSKPAPSHDTAPGPAGSDRDPAAKRTSAIRLPGYRKRRA